ncbi:hypothetical protein [uncultured Devosia sp.]|uniref:hypothetical protein n=1 Tax=uncultured Devosia sp. TaxID=211434 RepID=UPI0035CC4ADC
MPKPTSPPPFGPGPQGQLAPQAATAAKSGNPSPVEPSAPGASRSAKGRNQRPKATHALAERHEALWLSLTALHKDLVALGAKKPDAAVSEPVRIVAEGLLSDGLPFTRQRRERFPVAAGDLAGLAVQLGQALAGLDVWESLNTTWDERYKCRIWRVDGAYRPVMRLKPPALALKHPRDDMADIRRKLVQRLDARQRATYQQGFEAGRAARTGPPEAEPEPAPQTYPRLSPLA